jgi:hypothetical protein
MQLMTFARWLARKAVTAEWRAEGRNEVTRSNHQSKLPAINPYQFPFCCVRITPVTIIWRTNAINDLRSLVSSQSRYSRMESGRPEGPIHQRQGDHERDQYLSILESTGPN